MTHDLDLDAFIARAEQAYTAVRDRYGADDLPSSVRQHFNRDVPELIGAIRRMRTALGQEPARGATMGPYDTERQALDEPLGQAVRSLHDTGQVRSGDPDRLVRGTVLDHLTDACAAAGVELGDYDRRVLAWLAGGVETAVVQVVIGLITRAAAGAAPVSTPVQGNRQATSQDLLAGDLMAACIDRDIDLSPGDRRALRSVAGVGATTTAAVIGLIARSFDQLPESVLDLIRDLTDRDQCSFDHHGGCQAHDYLDLAGRKCPHREAKELLAKHRPEQDGGVNHG